MPNTILWTPTSAGAPTYAYTMTFNYTSNVPQSSLTKYIGGTSVTDAKLLSSIAISHSGTVVKDYFLGYQASPTTGRDELISVKECADSTQTNCLLPTSVTYQNGSAGVSTTSTTALSSAGASLSARYDLNGDGYPDLVYLNGSTTYVSFGSATGYGTPVNTGVLAQMIGNLNGGKQDGLLAVNGGTWWYYTWNGTSFTGTSTGLAYDSTANQYQLADVNGDGLPDLVSLYVVYNPTRQKYFANVYTRLNTGTGGAVSFSSTLTEAYSSGSIASAQLETPDMQYGKLRRYDFNGDGCDDVVLALTTGTSPNYTVSTYELISTGTAFTAVLASSVVASSYYPVFFTNWNDDACTDFVAEGTLYISGCNGTIPTTYSVGNVVAAMDWDGDGRTDLVVSNGSTLGVYLSTGAGPASLLTTSIPYTSTCLYVTMDANGDGLDDLGCWSQTSPYSLSYRLHNGAGQPPDLVSSIADGYGNSVHAYYTSIAQGAYTNASDAVYPYQNYIGPYYVAYSATFSDPSKAPGQTYSQSYHYGGAWMNLQGRGFAGFQSRSTTDTRTALYEAQYYERAFPYTGMTYEDVWSNGSVYPTITEGGPATITLDSTSNNQRYFPYFSFVTRNEVEVGGSENGDFIKQTETTYTYDNYGNATQITSTVTDKDPGSPYTGDTWTTQVTNTTDISVNQAADLAAWCLNMLDETQVVYSSTLSGSTSVPRTKTFTPDTPSECRIKTTVTEPTANSGLYKVTEALTFDSFGNVATDTVTGANMPSSPASRLTTLNWGTTGQFLDTQTDPSGATTTWTYSSNQSLTFGVPDSVKNANNLTTSWTYDAFGRKNKETRPDGTSTTWTWSACTSYCGWSNSVYQIAQTAYQTNGSTAIRTDTTSFDPVDRVTQTAGPNVTGATATVQKLYNSLGLLAQQSMPFLSGGTAYQQSFGYDVLNRLVEAERPVNASSGETYCNPATVPPASGCQGTSYAYAGRTLTVTDSLGHTKTTITDVNGWLRKTTDAVGFYVTKAYDSAGSVIGVTDSAGNSLLKSVTYAYGIKPFLLAATDADRGAWSYTVDSLGERTGWADAKGQTFSMTYDALSRRLTRTEPDLFSQWTWGSTPASHNVGQLISECTGTGGACSSAGYLESRTFDSLGRLSTRAITEAGNAGNDPGGVFLFTSAYDSTTGFPKTLTYPISTSSFALTIQYGYQYGLLQSVIDTSDTVATCGSTCTLWTANAVNAFGQITQETLGNGVVTNRTYDAVTSWLSAATGGVGGGAALLNQSYLEDKNGSIIQRQNNNLGLTESFAYDADNRLTCTALSSTCTTSTLAYDGGVAGPGNITSQSGVGTYTYPAAGQPRPHAVTSITGTFNGIVNPTFSYDANGNMTERASTTQNVYWTSSNYLDAATAIDATGTETVSFAYGPGRQRVQQNFSSPGGYESTYYIGGLIDKVVNGGVIDYRQYIYAASEPIAVYSRTAAGVNTMSYMLADHQSSPSTITSKAGAVDVNESFSAFGTRRNPSTWSGAPSTADLNTIAGLSRQGYTFQTWLGQSMGLNHLNGRVEDAILGRFLSPDPHIPNRTDAQSYNRYTYVNNNPATLTDPTGFSPYVKCKDFCPAGGGRKLNYDPGSNLGFNPGVAAISNGITGTAGDDSSSDGTEGYLTVTNTDTGESFTIPDAQGGNDAAGLSAAAAPVSGNSTSSASGGAQSQNVSDPSNLTPNTTTSTASPDGAQPGLGLNSNNLSQAAYFQDSPTPTSESVAGGVVKDILSDVGAAAIIVVCPECEVAALIVEIGGNLLGGAEAYYGARGNLGPVGGGGTQGSNP